MLKTYEKVKNLDHLAEDAARDLLCGVLNVVVEPIGIDRKIIRHYGFDGLVGFAHDDNAYMLVVEAKSSGAPRFVRSGVYHLESMAERLRRSCEANTDRRLIPMLVSPYLSPESRAICVEHGIAYLDLVGNARVAFDNVYIERTVAEKPVAETRALRSIFTPRAAAILRVLLRDPERPWRVADLSAEARASYGHVSNVRKALMEREWAEVRDDGIVLTRPEVLLQTWRENYRSPVVKTVARYTHLQGAEFDARLRGTLNPNSARPRAIFSNHSAARWIAPFGRTVTQSFYVDESGAEAVKDALELTHAGSGANVVLQILTDKSWFDDAYKPRPNVFCTSPIVTYLDLWNGGDRDREAAEHLAGELFSWLK